MAFLKKAGSSFIFSNGKHPNETLEHVAQVDPNYLRWARNKASDALEDDAFYALEEVMKRFDISPTRKKK